MEKTAGWLRRILQQHSKLRRARDRRPGHKPCLDRHWLAPFRWSERGRYEHFADVSGVGRLEHGFECPPRVSRPAPTFARDGGKKLAAAARSPCGFSRSADPDGNRVAGTGNIQATCSFARRRLGV